MKACLILLALALTAAGDPLSEAYVRAWRLGSHSSAASSSAASLLVGGRFNTMGGEPMTRIARINADGSLDGTFGNPALNQALISMSFQPDGKILISGFFDAVGGVQRRKFARLNADGTLDATFSTGFMVGNNYRGWSAVCLPDGFTILCTHNAWSLIHGDIVKFQRLNFDGSDGELTYTLYGGFFGGIYVLPDGGVLVYGNFTGFEGVARSRIARLTAGTLLLDDAFVPPSINAGIDAVAVQADGKVLIAGGFNTIGEASIGRLARLNADGSLDESFDPAPSHTVHSIIPQADGGILIGGAFTSVGGVPWGRLALLNADGTLDDTLVPPVLNAAIWALAMQADGRLVIGGEFSTVNQVSRAHIARLEADWSLDVAFDPTAGDRVQLLEIP